MNNRYIASDGTTYDIKEIHTERLINSLSKHQRDLYASNNLDEYLRHIEQIDLIEGELSRRAREFYEKKIGGGLWN